MPKTDSLDILPSIKSDVQSPVGARGERIAIIGAGIGGAMTALKLADVGYDVVLIEAGNDIMQATSKQNGQNVHLGFQYPLDTTGASARKCIEAAIQFQKAYGDFAGKVRNVFIANESSLITADDYREYCELIKNIYAQMIKESPDKKVFGEPEDFYKELTAKDAPYVNWDAVDAGFETSEQVIDIDALRKYLKTKLHSARNITFLPDTQVVAVDKKENEFVLSTQKNNDGKSLDVVVRAHQLVNAGWVYSRELGSEQGVELADAMTFREKPVLVTHLETPEVASSLVMLGGYSAITNTGDGKYTVLASPKNEHAITQQQAAEALDSGLRQDRGPKADGIIAAMLGVTRKFFPAFAGARDSELYHGYMMTQGNVEHSDRASSVHRRDGNWGSVASLGAYHELNTGKLTGAAEASDQALQAVKSYSLGDRRIYAVSGNSAKGRHTERHLRGAKPTGTPER